MTEDLETGYCFEGVSRQPWTAIPVHLMHEAAHHVKPTAFKLLYFIAERTLNSRADPNGEPISIGWLIKVSNLCQNTVEAGTRELVMKGFVIREQRWKREGGVKQLASSYRIRFKDEAISMTPKTYTFRDPQEMGQYTPSGTNVPLTQPSNLSNAAEASADALRLSDERDQAAVLAELGIEPEMVASYPPEAVAFHLEDLRRRQLGGQLIRHPAGFLVASLKNDYKPYDGPIDRFLRHWQRLYEREMRQSYDVVTGKDVGIVKNLLRQAPIDELLSVVTHFWEHRNDEEGTTLGYFKVAYRTIVQDKAARDRMLGRND
jgi:hypothetical protein